MHGSSSVPQDLQDIINQYGGKMPQTWGVPVEEIQRGIKHGVRKINIDTDNRMAMTGQIRKVLAENPGEFDPRKYLKPAMEAMTKLCKQRLQEFSTAGQASKIKRVLTLGRNGQALRRRASSTRSSAREPPEAGGVTPTGLSPPIIDQKRGLARWPRFRYGVAHPTSLSEPWTHGRTAARLFSSRPSSTTPPRSRRRLAEACAAGRVAAVLLAPAAGRRAHA